MLKNNNQMMNCQKILQNLVTDFGEKISSEDSKLSRLCFSLDNESDEIQFTHTGTSDVNCIRYVKE